MKVILSITSLLALAGLTLAPASDASQTASPKKPNIVVIMTDDQALADVSKLPNVNKLLVDKGINFTNAVDSFPLCCPARATFITGQYAHNHKVIGNFYPYGWYGMENRDNILPAWLQKSGYRTGLVGKWLNGYGAKNLWGEKPAGFDIWRGLLDVSAYDYYNFVMSVDGESERVWGDEGFARGLVRVGQIQTVPRQEPVRLEVAKRLIEVFGLPPYSYWGSEKPEDYTVDVTGSVFQDLIAAEQNQSKPFFLWWAPAAPHREDVATTLMGRPGQDPRPPKRYQAKSKSYKLPRPKSFNQAEKSFRKLPKNMTDNLKPLTEGQIDQLQLDYEGRIGSLLAVDDKVKSIVDKLKETGQYNNTVIIFTSDNGWLQGEHRVPGDKFLPYEESVKVPFIVTGPGIKKKKVTTQVSNVDFAATITKLAGARPGRLLDGQALLPLRKTNRAVLLEAPAPLFASPSMPQQWDQPYKGVRTNKWKYVIYQKGGEELYDLTKDPYEINNLAGEKKYASKKKEMKSKLKKLEDCRGKRCLAVKAH